MSPIKDFKVSYEALNKDDTFSARDLVVGAVTFCLSEEVKVKSLSVKVKGEAGVMWTECHGYGSRRTHDINMDGKRYYSVKELLIEEKDDGTVLAEGDHHFPFELKIPDGNFPPSFEADYGRVSHELQAKLSRDWHTSTKDKKKLKFLSTAFSGVEQTAQSGSVEKTVGTFSRGDVHLSAIVDKGACSPGDTLLIKAKITNKTDKELKLKGKIDKKIMYRTTCTAKIEDKHVCKEVGEKLPARFEGESSFNITVPQDCGFSILNYKIITVEFYLKVYLDVSYDEDPEVVLPLIIVPPNAIVQKS